MNDPLVFPGFDPIAIQIGPLAIRWYALAYVVSLLLGWRYVHYLSRRGVTRLGGVAIDDLLLWATLGVVLGGRLGYVLFYRLGHYLANPLEALAIWQGGMSFHGGLIGVIIAMVVFARRQKVSVFEVSDPVAAAVPIGLFFGRLSNFINGELFGRAGDVPWAMVFPMAGPEPRHPSQLYQAALEGALLFVVLAWLAHNAALAGRRGLLTGVFLAGYALARMIGELFRQPDAHIGFLAGGITMGQLLSLPMLLAGLWLIWRARASP